MLVHREITEKIISSSIEVHKELGPGLLESSYEECLFYELQKSGLFVERQKPLPLVYKTVRIEIGYRIDLMMERKVIVEIKAVDAINDIHRAQIITHLKLSSCRIGILVNFNVTKVMNGFHRFIV